MRIVKATLGADAGGTVAVKIIARDRLILALDLPSAAEAERLMDQVQDQITFVKVGLELFTAAGPEIVQRLLKRGKRVFLDLKFLDRVLNPHFPQVMTVEIRQHGHREEFQRRIAASLDCSR